MIWCWSVLNMWYMAKSLSQCKMIINWIEIGCLKHLFHTALACRETSITPAERPPASSRKGKIRQSKGLHLRTLNLLLANCCGNRLMSLEWRTPAVTLHLLFFLASVPIPPALYPPPDAMFSFPETLKFLKFWWFLQSRVSSNLL